MKPDKKYITLSDENGKNVLYEVIGECSYEKNNYIAIVPVSTKYYVLKETGNDSFVSVEGEELKKVESIFQDKLSTIDYDE